MNIIHIIEHSAQIIGIVFVLMIIIEYIELRTRGKVKNWLGKSKGRQYLASSTLGVTPGCAGAFGAVTLYTHGFLSIGSITAAMIATSGDGAFLMLALFPKKAVILFTILFLIGIVGGFFTDKITKKLNIQKCKKCQIKTHITEKQEPKQLTLKHFFKEHVYQHIIKDHLPKIILWVTGGLLIIEFLNAQIGLETILQGLPILILLATAVIVGLIPGSGPNIPFVLLFSTGAIPFSVLLANSIVQDGHGLFPLLSFTVRDSLMVKIFNALIGLTIGLAVVALGW